MVWPFPKNEEITPKEILKEEQKSAIMQAMFDPKVPIDEEQAAARKEAHAQIMQWQQDRKGVFCRDVLRILRYNNDK